MRPPTLRLASAAMMLAFFGSTILRAQSIDLALDIYYANPSSPGASGGSWELVALGSDRGISSVTARIEAINAGAMLMAPTGTGTGLARSAGFQATFAGGAVSFARDLGTHWELQFSQVPETSPGPQGLMYDVGVPGGATQPGENGTPTIAGLSGTNIPWDYDDLLGDFIGDSNQSNNNGTFHNGALLGLGMFSGGNTPAFFAGAQSTGNVFTALGTASDPPVAGSILAATVNVQVRDNTGLLGGDANMDGVVDGQDFITWNDNKFTATAGWRNADFNGDKVVDGQDFIIWNDNKFLSVDAVPAVPEPRGMLLLLIGSTLLLLVHVRSPRAMQMVKQAVAATLVAGIAAGVAGQQSTAAEQAIGAVDADTMIAFDFNGDDAFTACCGVVGEDITPLGNLDFMTIRGGEPFNRNSLTSKALVRFDLGAAPAIDPNLPYFVEVTTNSAGNSNDTFRIYSISDAPTQSFGEATFTWDLANTIAPNATDNSNNFTDAGPEVGIYFAPSPGQAGVKIRVPMMGSQINTFADGNVFATFGFTSTEINRMEIRSKEQSGGVDKARLFSYDAIDSNGTGGGNISSAATWNGSLSAGSLYRVQSGDTATVTASAFVGEGIVVQDGTLDFAASGVDINTIVINANGNITNSVGSLEIGSASADRSGGLILNRDLTYNAGSGEDLTINLPLRSYNTFTFNGGLGSDLSLKYPQGHRGVLRFEGQADELAIGIAGAGDDEGVGGVWEMNSTGANRLVFNGIDSEQEFGVGTVIFNQPGEIDHRSNDDRLHGMAFLEVNAPLTIDLTKTYSGNERRLRITRELTGSADITLNGTAFDPTSGSVTRNEFEVSTSDGSQTNIRSGSYSGTITTSDYVTVKSRQSLPAAKVVINANAELTAGYVESTEPLVSLGEVEFTGGNTQLNVGHRGAESNPEDEQHIVQKMEITTAGGRSGNLTLHDGTTTRMQINGSVDGEFDQLFVQGTGALDGTLEVLINPISNLPTSYSPALGDTFELIVASASLSPADFDGDGDVDNDDLGIWEVALQNGTAGGDADGDGDTDGDDFQIWQQDFGTTGGAGTLTGTFDAMVVTDPIDILGLLGLQLEMSVTSSRVQVEVVSGLLVPEPARNLGLCILSAMAMLVRRRRNESVLQQQFS